MCVSVFCEERRQTSAAAQFPGKSEGTARGWEKEGCVGGGGWWLQINNFLEEGWGVGRRIRKDEGRCSENEKEEERQSFRE